MTVIADTGPLYALIDSSDVWHGRVATAERLDVREILTTDRRRFSVVRPLHVKKLTLLP